MQKFQKIKNDDSIKVVVKTAFDAEFDIDGGWGYTQDEATIINSTQMPLKELEHTIATMRAYLEMNMTLNEDERYGSINLNEIARETITINQKIYDKIDYTISAMNEKLYAKFINEYKKGYGTKEFDLNKHFKDRKEATINRKVSHWFDKTNI